MTHSVDLNLDRYFFLCATSNDGACELTPREAETFIRCDNCRRLFYFSNIGTTQAPEMEWLANEADPNGSLTRAFKIIRAEKEPKKTRYFR